MSRNEIKTNLIQNVIKQMWKQIKQILQFNKGSRIPQLSNIRSFTFVHSSEMEAYSARP